ncbi:protein FAM110A [Eudromia elegans]
MPAGGAHRPAAPFASAMPLRILNKGPEYFRRAAEPGARRPSAVERLEADKAKYVKSQRVASTRQEPVRPSLLQPPPLAPAGRRVALIPGRRAPAGSWRLEPTAPKPSLDLEILNKLINVCDGPFPPAETPRGPGSARAPEASGSTERTAGAVKAAGVSRVGAVAVRRVDVRPCGALSATTVAPASPIPVPSARSPVRSPCTEGACRQPLLHRSKSDLSDRYSRATADLERFFNYCGLDPEELQGLGAERFARAASDVVSVRPPSGSPASSEGGRSPSSAASPAGRPPERMPYGISVVERNARVIKWLYGLRQAREPQKVSNV